MNTESIRAAVESAKQNGGGTFKLEGDKVQEVGFGFKYGYISSFSGNNWDIGELTQGLLATYVSVYKKELSLQGTYLGVWFDKDTGLWNLDTSVMFAYLDNALAFAKANHQKAIWDFSTKSEILVEEELKKFLK